MIYTVTLNPAVDYTLFAPNLHFGEINHGVPGEFEWGGKGINVSRILKEFGTPSVALGFIAGFTGTALAEGLDALGLTTDFVSLSTGNTRINIKIRAKEETDLSGIGPEVDAASMEAFLKKIDALRDGDTLVLAGSIPPSLPANTYEEIIRHIDGKNIWLVVDAAGELLERTLTYKPFLIKPNQEELEELSGHKIRSWEDAATYGTPLLHKGARNVLVSLGKEGAVLLAEDGGRFGIKVPDLPVVNTTGAGDSMLAGFLASTERTPDPEHALRMSAAAGTATACTSSLANYSRINEVLTMMEGATPL